MLCVYVPKVCAHKMTRLLLLTITTAWPLTSLVTKLNFWRGKRHRVWLDSLFARPAGSQRT